MRFALLVTTLLFISPTVFAQQTQGDLQLTIEEVRDERTTADWRQLEVSIVIKGSLLKDTKRERVQILKAEDNLGIDLKPEEFNEYYKDFCIMETKDNAGILITLNLASPSRKATHIKNIEGTLELYIPDLDPKAKIVLSDLNEKLNDKSYGQRINTFPFRPAEPFPFQKFGVSIDIGFSTFPNVRREPEPVIHVQILDKHNKVLDVILTDKKGNEIQSQWKGWTEDKTNLGYRFDADPAEIADLVVYLKTDKAIKIIPLEINNVPLP